MNRAAAIAALLLALGTGATAVGQDQNQPAPQAPARPPSLLEQLDDAVCAVVERARPSVCQVLVRRSIEIEGAVQRDQVGISATIWSPDGYIVSLGRAFESADAIEVVLASGEARPAELIGTDEDTGLALLKIDPAGLKAPLRPAPLGTSKTLRPGSIVVAVSNPFGLPGSAALGNVAGVKRVVKRGRMALTDVLQISTPVNPGDPGGLLANCRGEVVGIVASTYERSVFDSEALGKIYRDILRFGEGIFGKPAPDELRRLGNRDDGARYAGPASGGLVAPPQGIGFAVPIDQAKEVVDRLKAGPLAERAYLGVQVVPAETGPGKITIVGVKEGSPAEKAGLRQFDIVLKYDGREVTTMRDFKRFVLDSPIGRAIKIEVQRGDARVSIDAVLETRSKKP